MGGGGEKKVEKESKLVIRSKQVQSNLDYPDLSNPDFSIIRTFSLLPILS